MQAERLQRVQAAKGVREGCDPILRGVQRRQSSEVTEGIRQRLEGVGLKAECGEGTEEPDRRRERRKLVAAKVEGH